MPLRDHFRPPLDDVHSWDELHGGWPMVMVQHLVKVLPEPYYAGPGVYLGSLFEIDVATFRELNYDLAADHDGGIALASAPPKTTFSIVASLPGQDVYEVRIYDNKRNRRLVAAVEIISPSNKDRSDRRETFTAKVLQLLKNNISVSIVDIIGTLDFNLCEEILAQVNSDSPISGDESMYATTLRARYDRQTIVDAWYYPLAVGQPLPSLPIWLNSTRHVTLDLEATYEDCCRALRIR